MRQQVWPTLKSRLSRKVALAVFASLLAIEAAILIPSYIQRENDLTERLHDVAVATIESRLLDSNFESDSLGVSSIGAFLPLEEALGMAVFEYGVQTVGLGEMPSLGAADITDAIPVGTPTDADTKVDLAWRFDTPDGRALAVAVRLDMSLIAADLRAFVLRIAFLVFIIALVVTSATMTSVWLLVLKPLLDLQGQVMRFREVGTPMSKKARDLAREDEIGSLYRSFDAMVDRVVASSSELMVSHQNLEALVNDRTKKLKENEN